MRNAAVMAITTTMTKPNLPPPRGERGLAHAG